MLVITNAQSVVAGAYTALLTNNAGSATSRPAILRVNSAARPVLFADAVTGTSATNWLLFWGAADGVPDYTVDWAFDYGSQPYTFNGATALIPPAPNSVDGSTRAVRFTPLAVSRARAQAGEHDSGGSVWLTNRCV